MPQPEGNVCLVGNLLSLIGSLSVWTSKCEKYFSLYTSTQKTHLYIAIS